MSCYCFQGHRSHHGLIVKSPVTQEWGSGKKVGETIIVTFCSATGLGRAQTRWYFHFVNHLLCKVDVVRGQPSALPPPPQRRASPTTDSHFKRPQTTVDYQRGYIGVVNQRAPKRTQRGDNRSVLSLFKLLTSLVIRSKNQPSYYHSNKKIARRIRK